MFLNWSRLCLRRGNPRVSEKSSQIPAEAAKLDIPADAAYLAGCRAFVTTLAASLSFTLPEIEEIRVLVSEGVSNAILHAYPPGGPQGRVRLIVSVTAEALRLRIEDDGRGIDHIERALLAGESTAEERLGLGFAFLQSLSDHLEVKSAPGCGTTIELVKYPGRPLKTGQEATPGRE